jgi:hypothetical protein
LNVERFENEGLLIDYRFVERTIRLVWSGRSTARNPSEVLNPYLEKVAETAKGLGVDVEMHLQRLEYLNSSTIAALIRALRILRRQKTKTVLIYDGELGWQQRSFEALSVFQGSDGLVEIRGV